MMTISKQASKDLLRLIEQYREAEEDFMYASFTSPHPFILAQAITQLNATKFELYKFVDDLRVKD